MSLERTALFTSIANVNAACAVLSHIYGGDQADSFSIRLSLTGTEPATHFGASGGIPAEGLSILAGQTALDWDNERDFWEAAAYRGLSEIAALGAPGDEMLEEFEDVWPDEP